MHLRFTNVYRLNLLAALISAYLFPSYGNGMFEEGFACRELLSSGNDGDIGYAMVALLQIIPLLFSLIRWRKSATPIDLLIFTLVTVFSWIFSLILIECGSIIETVMTRGGSLLGLSLFLFAVASVSLITAIIQRSRQHKAE